MIRTLKLRRARKALAKAQDAHDAAMKRRDTRTMHYTASRLRDTAK